MTRVELLEELLEQIGISAGTLARFATQAAALCTQDPLTAAYTMHAMQAMAERIGALATLVNREDPLAPVRHLVGDHIADALGAERESKGGAR